MTPPLDNIPPPSQNRETRTQIQKPNPTRPAAPEQGINCPRCDSPNTKFCYYNNYSLTQPRYFCKTCRRYWTNGGALRNVPVGGGCRKNKRTKSSSSSSSSSSRSLSCDPKDFQLPGLTIPPSLDFSIGGLPFPPPPITPGMFNFNHLPSFPNINSIPASTNPLSGFHIDPTATSNSMAGLVPPNTEFWSLGQSQNPTLSHPLNTTMQTMAVGGNLTSSIERLGNMNQEQHQNLETLFGGPSQNGNSGNRGARVSLSQPAMMNGFENHKVQQLQQPILFRQNNLGTLNSENLPGGSSVRETPKIGGDTLTSTECFSRNPFSAVTTAATASNHGNNVDVNHVNNNNWDNDALSWEDLQQQPFSSLL